MPLTPELNAEIRILNLYNLDSVREGLKVHHDADAEAKLAIERLHQKGLLTQQDGGYLTDLGVHCAEHIQSAMRILTTPTK